VTGAAGTGETRPRRPPWRASAPLHAVTGRATRFSQPSAALIRRTLLGGSLVGGVALVAVGLSAALSWGLAAIRAT
jgi:hypothetical protein